MSNILESRLPKGYTKINETCFKDSNGNIFNVEENDLGQKYVTRNYSCMASKQEAIDIIGKENAFPSWPI